MKLGDFPPWPEDKAIATLDRWLPDWRETEIVVGNPNDLREIGDAVQDALLKVLRDANAVMRAELDQQLALEHDEDERG